MLTRAGVFALVVAVVVAASVAGSVLLPPGVRDTGVPYPAAADTLPARAAASGTPSTELTGGETRTVLVDASHANRFDDGDVAPLVRAVQSAGHEVRFVRGGDSLERALADADALVVVDPGLDYTDSEVGAVEEFVADGGRLVVMGEPTRVQVSAGPFGATLVRVRSHLHALADPFGVEFGTEYLYNTRTNEGNYKRIYATAAGPVANVSVGRTAFYTATTVRAAGGTPVLTTTPGTRLSGMDTDGARTVAAVAANGRVLALGDSTFLAGGKHAVVDNERLVDAVARFLVAGDHRRDLLDYPAVAGDEPRVAYTSDGLLNASKALARDLRDAGARPRVVRADAPSTGSVDVLVTTYADLPADAGGITVTATRVETPGFSGARANVTVVRAPSSGYDLIVAGETAADVRRGVGVLADGIAVEAISNRTAVVRVPDGGSSGSGGGNATGGAPTGPTTSPSVAPGGDPVRSVRAAEVSI